MILRKTLLYLISVSLLAAGCGSSAETATSITAPASTRCTATVSTAGGTIPAAGGTGTLNISVARECSWRATSPAPWVTFTSGVEGQGDGTVSFAVAENADPVVRQTALSVADRSVALSQGAAPCRYNLSGVPSLVDGKGGDSEIRLETHPACAWTAQPNQPWARVSPSSGSGPSLLQIALDANGSANQRTVVVSVGGLAISLTQAPAVPAAVPPTPPAPVPPPPPLPAPPTPAPPAPAPPAPPNPAPPNPAPPSPAPPAPAPPNPAPPTPAPPNPAPPSPAPPPPAPPNPTPPPPSPTPPPPAPNPPAPTPVGEIELKGIVRNAAGSCASMTFTVDNRSVYTTADTKFNGGPCSAVGNGSEVEVEATLMSDGRARAERIKIEK